MIQKERIEELVREAIAGSSLFLVSVKVSSGNRITVLADRNEGITIDECVAIHRHIEAGLDRDAEDFELQVSSPGADSPFHVTEQYLKYEGKKIEVIDAEGKRYAGVLKNVTGGGFELECEVKVKGKGKEIKDFSFNLDQVKTARAILTI
ncbi:MAG: ribosome assembly cofactor RimP [Bacteroidales bacterium]|nr:ribosome assembly cofactor RimP [Bacteroidales bacterium]